MKVLQKIAMAVFIISILISVGVTIYVYSNKSDEKEVNEAVKNTYIVEEKSDYDVFTNLVKGYELPVKKGMTYDMSYADVCAILTDRSTRIEIYKQKLTKEVNTDTYINYSNGFMENAIDHKNISVAQEQYGENIATVSRWSREKFSRVSNDLNNYVVLDIGGENVIYSVFIKSSKPIQQSDYDFIIKGFKTTSVSAAPFIAKTKSKNIASRNWNSETKDFYKTYFGKNSTLTWGLFEPEIDKNYKKVKEYEDYFQYDFPVLLWYNHITEKSDINYWETTLENAYKHGKVVELTLQTTDIIDDQGNITGENMVYDILDGKYDRFLKDYAKTIKKFEHPVLFRLGNEMNGDWCSYSGYQCGKDSEIFKDFYRYVADIFRDEDVDNAIWIWNPNGESKPDFDWNHSLMYYPGSEYVDIVGLTAYNTGTYYENIGETWQSFGELYKPLYKNYAKWFSEPLMITEFSSASMGGDKNKWIQDMFAEIPNYPKIKMAVWWDGCDRDTNGTVARSYVMDESPEIMQSFKQGFSDYK
ncbi:MAG: glycosyl hydrolase [Clostridiales bacterium]